MIKMKKLISMSLALAIAATSFVGLSASAATRTEDELIARVGKNVSTDAVYNDGLYVSGGQNASFDVTKGEDGSFTVITNPTSGIKTTVDGYTVNGTLGGDGNVKIDDSGVVTVSKSAPVGTYIIKGVVNSKSPADIKVVSTKNINFNVVKTEDLGKAVDNAKTAAAGTVYKETAKINFTTQVKNLATAYPGIITVADKSKFDSVTDIALAGQISAKATPDTLKSITESMILFTNQLTGQVVESLTNLVNKVSEVNALHSRRLTFTSASWNAFITELDLIIAGKEVDGKTTANLVTRDEKSTEDGTQVKSFKIFPKANAESNTSNIKHTVTMIENAISVLTNNANKSTVMSDLDVVIYNINTSNPYDRPTGFTATLKDIIDGSKGLLVGGKGSVVVAFATTTPDKVTPDVAATACAALVALYKDVDKVALPTAKLRADLVAVVDLVNAQVADKSQYALSDFTDFKNLVSASVDSIIIEKSTTEGSLIKVVDNMANDVTKVQMQTVVDKLESAVKKLTTSKDALNDYITFVNTRVQANYTTTSWNYFSTSVVNALASNLFTLDGSFGSISIKSDLSNYGASIRTSLSDLKAAVANLNSLDAQDGYDTLQAILAVSKVNNALGSVNKYTEKSQKDFKEALARAEEYAVFAKDGDKYKVGTNLTKAMTQAEFDAHASNFAGLTSILVAKSGEITAVVAAVNEVVANKVAYTVASYNEMVTYIKTIFANSTILTVAENGTITLKNINNVSADALKQTEENLQKALNMVKKASGWIKNAEGKWNYVKDGAMQTGWLKDAGTWYYLGTDGVMQTGWAKVSNKWYFLKGDGAMATRWVKVDNKWYFLNDSGAMLTGWAFTGGKWYFLNNNGSMKTGWFSQSGTWYFLNNGGDASAAKWQWIGGKCYYFFSNAKMAANTTVDGYKLNASGAWVK